MNPKNFFVLSIVSSMKLCLNDPNNFCGDLTELNLAADNIRGPLLKNFLFLKLQSSLSEKMGNYQIVRMRTPDEAFRTTESNNMGVFTRKFQSKFDNFIYSIGLQNAMSY